MDFPQIHTDILESEENHVLPSEKNKWWLIYIFVAPFKNISKITEATLNHAHIIIM